MEISDIECKMQVRGTKEELKVIISKHFKNKNFAFETIIPVPTEISKEKKKRTESIWQHWYHENWGTTFNAFDTLPSYKIIQETTEGNHEICIDFLVRDILPELIFTRISELYPDVYFTIHAINMNGNLARIIRCKEGNLCEENHDDDWKFFAKAHFDLKFKEDGEG